jgi:hypothetical protein
MSTCGTLRNLLSKHTCTRVIYVSRNALACDFTGRANVPQRSARSATFRGAIGRTSSPTIATRTSLGRSANNRHHAPTASPVATCRVRKCHYGAQPLPRALGTSRADLGMVSHPHRGRQTYSPSAATSRAPSPVQKSTYPRFRCDESDGTDGWLNSQGAHNEATAVQPTTWSSGRGKDSCRWIAGAGRGRHRCHRSAYRDGRA